MKLIIQGQTLALEGDDGALVQIPANASVEIADPRTENFSPPPPYQSTVTICFRLANDQIIHRPENAAEAEQTSVTLGEARGTHHAEYLLVFQPPPLDLNRTTRLRLNGWTCTGGIQIKGELAPIVPFVWVFKRTVEGPPPELVKLTIEERVRLFRGIWTPDDINALEHDLVRAFAPCLLGHRNADDSVTETRGPFTSPDQLTPSETASCS